MNKHHFFRSTAFAISTVCAIAIASAADLPTKSAPYFSPAPAFSWSGLYVGGSLGAAVAKGSVTDLSGSLYDAGASGLNHSLGAIVGADVGYNFQSGNLVYGVEADISYISAKSDLSLYNVTPDDHLRSTSNELITARARLGYAVDKALFFVSGGLAFGNPKVSATGNFGPTDFGTAGVSSWRTGWTIGGGMEYAVAQNWTVRVEGYYVDFGSKNAATLSSETSTPMAFRFNDQEVFGRMGVNYKF